MTDDYYHHTHVAVDNESRELARNAAKTSAENDARLDQLEKKVDKLVLLNEALFELLVTKTGVDTVELYLMIEKVEANRSNRVHAKLACSKCSMRVPAKKEQCMYCGGELIGELQKSAFDI